MSAPLTVRSSAVSPLGATAVGAAATPAVPLSRYLCFGGFQLDTQRELLLKDGAKMRLPGKVFQTLAALLERPGEVVTREALRERLWPEGTFVNYDANVNTTVNKLRLALGDSPEQPAYIETIPRLGYCFVGPVERRDDLPKVAIEATLSTPAETAGPEGAAKAPEPSAPDLWAGWKWKGLAAVVLLCGVLIGMGIVLLAHRI
jgi:DNA-binding winged helix-turn-helix (wHTH) protein